VAFLPFLEAGWVDEDEQGTQPRVAGQDDQDDGTQVYINMGKQGLSYSDGALPTSPDRSDSYDDDDDDDDEAKAKKAEEDEFAQRRLSVHNPFDEDWNDAGEEEDEEEEPPKPGVGTQRA